MIDRDKLAALHERATKGEWETAEDILGSDYLVEVVLPGRAGGRGPGLARCDHNWTEAEAGEHRISWKEAESNAALIALLCSESARTEILAMMDERDRLREALRECADDLEAEIEARRGAVLERTMERDLATVRLARTALGE